MDSSDVENYRKENPTRNVAVVGLRDNEGKILLVRTHKLPDSWQPVGGGIDSEDVSPISAAVREVKEELGVELDPLSLHLATTRPYDFGEGTIYFYEALLFDATNLCIDPVEILEHKWFSLSEAVTLSTFPATRDFLNLLSSRNR